jgi:hypothetical protein
VLRPSYSFYCSIFFKNYLLFCMFFFFPVCSGYFRLFTGDPVFIRGPLPQIDQSASLGTKWPEFISVPTRFSFAERAPYNFLFHRVRFPASVFPFRFILAHTLSALQSIPVQKAWEQRGIRPGQKRCPVFRSRSFSLFQPIQHCRLN